MSKLAGRTIKSKTYLLGDIEIALKPIPYGRVIKIQEGYNKVKDLSEVDQLKFITQILIDYTDLTTEDLGDNDYSLTIEEATDLFTALLSDNRDPKAPGQEAK